MVCLFIPHWAGYTHAAFMDVFGSSLRFAVKTVTDLTVTILVPAGVAAIGGKYLDDRYGTGHIYFAVFLALSFVSTVFILVKKVRQYAKEYRQLIAR